MQIKPVNSRILAKRLKEPKADPNGIVVPGSNAELDKFMAVKILKSSSELYKSRQVVIVPSYVDVVRDPEDDKKEYFIFHESDVVAVCEE